MVYILHMKFSFEVDFDFDSITIGVQRKLPEDHTSEKSWLLNLTDGKALRFLYFYDE